MSGLRFYFTVHPGDLMRSRLPEGADVMLVAAAHWDEKRRRFKVRRPPADHIGRLVIDSGGFTAARRWGRYPWSPEQYAEWIVETCNGPSGVGLARLDWCASMDYACEPAVDRSQLQTNLDRIKATHELEVKCRRVAPCLPWLPVLQGDTPAERRKDLYLRERAGLIPTERAGVGSVCGRVPSEAAEVLLLYGGPKGNPSKGLLPGVRLHGFGLDARTLDVSPSVGAVLESWDSYGWTWAPGTNGARDPRAEKRGGESRSSYLRRLAERYLHRTVRPRIVAAEAASRQLSLPLAAKEALRAEREG